MDDKIINIEELKAKKAIENLPNSFNLEDAVLYAKTIENNINYFYQLAMEDKKYQALCSEEQIKLLSNIYCSFFKILFSEIDDFNFSDDSNRIMYKFLSELHSICSNLSNVDEIKNKNNVLKYSEIKTDK